MKTRIFVERQPRTECRILPNTDTLATANGIPVLPTESVTVECGLWEESRSILAWLRAHGFRSVTFNTGAAPVGLHRMDAATLTGASGECAAWEAA